MGRRISIYATCLCKKGGVGQTSLCLDGKKEPPLLKHLVMLVCVHQVALYRFQAALADCAALFLCLYI